MTKVGGSQISSANRKPQLADLRFAGPRFFTDLNLPTIIHVFKYSIYSFALKRWLLGSWAVFCRNCGFAICGLAHLRNVRTCDSGKIIWICGFVICEGKISVQSQLGLSFLSTRNFSKLGVLGNIRMYCIPTTEIKLRGQRVMPSLCFLIVSQPRDERCWSVSKQEITCQETGAGEGWDLPQAGWEGHHRRQEVHGEDQGDRRQT